jgi:hypothetical protein
MEEITHNFLNHKPTKVTLRGGAVEVRDFDSAREAEAYGTGAAALIPWTLLFSFLNQGINIPDLAERFRGERRACRIQDQNHRRIPIVPSSATTHGLKQARSDAPGTRGLCICISAGNAHRLEAVQGSDIPFPPIIRAAGNLGNQDILNLRLIPGVAV